LAKKYNQKWRDRHRALWKAYYAANREALIAKAGQYERNNRLRLRARGRQRYAENLEKYRAIGRARYAKNPVPAKRAAQRRRALKKAATATLTAQEWERILKRFAYRCAYCKRDVALTLDHVIPLVKGGQHSVDNVVPACLTCNCSKSNRDVKEWLARGGAKGLTAKPSR
jgi:5-methylcytosine-specific restriction endonuclease McrA